MVSQQVLLCLVKGATPKPVCKSVLITSPQVIMAVGAVQYHMVVCCSSSHGTTPGSAQLQLRVQGRGTVSLGHGQHNIRRYWSPVCIPPSAKQEADQ